MVSISGFMNKGFKARREFIELEEIAIPSYWCLAMLVHINLLITILLILKVCSIWKCTAHRSKKFLGG